MKNNEELIDLRLRKAIKELYPSLSQDMQLLIDYALYIADTDDIVSNLATGILITNLELSRIHYYTKEEFFERLMKLYARKDKIVECIIYFPELVDKILSEEDANSIRHLYDSIIGFKVPKVLENGEEVYDESVEAAVNWWVNAVQSPVEFNETVPSALANLTNSRHKELSQKDIKTFRESLAKSIYLGIFLNKYHDCDLSVGYEACPILREAGHKIGLDAMLDFPNKVSMNITSSRVTIKKEGKSKEVIWSKDNPKLDSSKTLSLRK